MAVLSRRRRPLDHWPGFVDALAALLMVMVFVLMLFMLGQFVLSDAISGRDRALDRLNAELAALAQSLSLETEARSRAESEVGELAASLGAERRQGAALRSRLGSTEAALESAREDLAERRTEIARLSADIEALARLKAELEAEVARLAVSLDDSRAKLGTQTEISERALAQTELLNRQLAAVREQLEQLNAALAAAEAESRSKDLRIEELGRELNLALAQRVQELSRYRSEFFGRLREALGSREDIQIVGDRFVFSSEVLFPSASDELSEQGLLEVSRIAETLEDIAADMPDDLPWVLQVDGHTDRRPIRTARFPSNWELSSARAIAIVRLLRDRGIPPERLAATGYGEFQPLDPGEGEEALARNRRIELKLTSR